MPPETEPSEGSATDDRAQTLAKNEAFFRESNEQLEKEALDAGSTFDCICECSRRGCVLRLKISKAEYERVRARSDHFVVVHGHEDRLIEVVVETLPNYLVVEKRGQASIIARQTNPR